VRQTSDGGFIVVGNTTNYGTSGQDIYLIKTDADGNTVWTRTFGTNGSDNGSDIVQTDDGGYCIAGSIRDDGAATWDAVLIKTDGSGDVLWVETLDVTQSNLAHSLQQTDDGGYIVSGSARNLVTANSDVHLVKTDDNGSILWARTFSASGSVSGNSVVQASDGGYVVGGTVDGRFFYALKVDSNGNEQWSRELAEASDRCSSIIETSDDGFVMIGYTRSWIPDIPADVLLIKLDANGNKLWSKTFGGPMWDYGSMVLEASDGGLVLVGNTSSYGAGWADVYLVKTSCANFPSVAISTDDPTEFCQDDSVAVLLTSSLPNAMTYQWMRDGIAILNADSANYLATTAGSYSVSLTDSNGCSNVSNTVDVMVHSHPPKLLITQIGNTLSVIYPFAGIQWYLNGVAIPGAHDFTYEITESGTYQAESVWPYCTTMSDEFHVIYSGISQRSNLVSINLFPNPAQQSVTLEFHNPARDRHTIKVYDSRGALVSMIENITTDKINVEVTTLSSGLYLLHLASSPEVVGSAKLIVE